jgi:hypothetical protein
METAISILKRELQQSQSTIKLADKNKELRISQIVRNKEVKRISELRSAIEKLES